MHKIIISTLLLISVSFAQKLYPFVGAETSLVAYDGSTAPSVGFKYGIQNEFWRSTLNLEYSKNGKDSLTSFLFEADKGVLASQVKDIPFKPHLGFSVGMFLHDNDGHSDNSIGYGVNTGVTYLLNDTIDLDLTYRYIKIGNLESLNHINSLNLSLHYFY